MSATSELIQWSGSLTPLASDIGQARQKKLVQYLSRRLTSLLLGTLQWLQTTVDSIYPSQPTLSQAQSSFLYHQIYPLSAVAPTNVTVVPYALDC